MQRTFVRLALVILAVGCVVDNKLGGPPEEPDGLVDSANPDTADSATEELCNGVDDDGDGVVDEGFPDDDQNGRVDCLDASCPEGALPGAECVEVPEAECARTVPSGVATVAQPWNVDLAWEFEIFSMDDRIAEITQAQAVVGQLDDDNGDGDIDADDDPDIVVHVSSGWDNYLVALEGTGREKWVYAGPVGMAAAAVIADVDADDLPDVVTYGIEGQPLALDAAGELKWMSTETSEHGGVEEVVQVADLEGDGVPEVIVNDIVVSGLDGSLVFRLATDASSEIADVTIADLDLDGDQELFRCGIAYDTDGTVLWDIGESAELGCFGAAVQADCDAAPELVLVGDQLTFLDTDGTVLSRRDTRGDAGPPCVGDFDGDGESELVFPAHPWLQMYEMDGTHRWSTAIIDTSGLAGCSGIDLDGDGALEVLFAGQPHFGIYDGRTGVELWGDDHYSDTALEYPTPADVDGDGHTEILVTRAHRLPLMRVYTHAGRGWPDSEGWPLHDYAVTNIDGAHIPADPPPAWLVSGAMRTRGLLLDGHPDLTVELLGVCVTDCTFGPYEVSVRVINQGDQWVPAGTPLLIEALDGDVSRLVRIETLPAFAPRSSLPGETIQLSPSDVGSTGFRVTVDDDGAGLGVVDECDESNNRVEGVTGCP